MMVGRELAGVWEGETGRGKTMVGREWEGPWERGQGGMRAQLVDHRFPPAHSLPTVISPHFPYTYQLPPHCHFPPPHLFLQWTSPVPPHHCFLPTCLPTPPCLPLWYIPTLLNSSLQSATLMLMGSLVCQTSIVPQWPTPGTASH